MDWMTETVVRNWLDIEAKGLNTFVSINRKRIQELTATMTLLGRTDALLHRRKGIDPECDDVFPSYCFFINALNYQFNDSSLPGGKYTVANPEDPAKPFTGSFALSAKVYRAFGERVISAADLLPYFDTLEHVVQFLRGITDIPLPLLRLSSGEDYIYWLSRRFGGHPDNLLKAATHRGKLFAFRDGDGIVELCTEQFPVAYGMDVHYLHRKMFPFFKRAKLNSYMLHARALGSGGTLPRIADIADVGPIAEYQLVRKLRHEGVLVFTPELDERIEREEVFYNQSAEVIEMRAAQTVACVEWCKAWNCTARDLDAHLFYTSRGLPNKAYRAPSSDC